MSVTRRAADISAMLLPPLPVFRMEGMAAYPDAPRVKDRSNRGALTGERQDSITWVAEKAGEYRWPAIRFQWWDPDRKKLERYLIPGMSLSVDALPGALDQNAADQELPARARPLVIWASLALALLAGAWWLWPRWPSDRLGRLRRRIIPTKIPLLAGPQSSTLV